MDSTANMANRNSHGSSEVTILYNCMIVTMDCELRVFENGAIVIQGDKIISIGKSDDILHIHSSVTASSSIHDLHGQILLPGSLFHRFLSVDFCLST